MSIRSQASSSTLRRFGGSFFGFTSIHQVIHNLPDLDRLLAHGHHILDGEPRDWTILVRVFGGENPKGLREKIQEILIPINTATERLFTNEVNANAAAERADIPGKAASLVTFSDDPQNLARWEWSANVRVVTPNANGHGGAAEADLHNLIRDLGACVSIPQLYGQDFLDRSLTLLNDLWKFDNDLFPMLMVGVPEWAPFQVMKDGLAARSRLHQQLAALYKRADQYLKGESVDFNADMSDISHVVRERTKLYNKMDVPFRHRGQIDLGNLWAQNANTHPLVFWLVLYIYSTPGLVGELRKEISPYITLSDTPALTITVFDLRSICSKCPLLRSSMYETFRMANQPTSIRYLNRPMTIHDGQQEHHLKSGTWISAVHAVLQKDSSVYPEPEKFIPDRFLESDKENGNKVARYGKLRPWGTGPGMCKGRIFAEKEILGIAAAVIALWDIEPVSKVWKVPAMRPGTGVNRPVHDVRVIIKKRVMTQ